MTKDDRVETMIDRFTTWNNMWGKHHGEDWEMDREYFLSYTVNTMPVDPRDTDDDPNASTIVVAYCAVSDELNNLTLLGVFEGKELVYATVEVDTDWAEFYKGTYPTGLIDTTKPYIREEEYLRTPENPPEWHKGYDAGYAAYARELDKGE